MNDSLGQVYFIPVASSAAAKKQPIKRCVYFGLHSAALPPSLKYSARAMPQSKSRDGWGRKGTSRRGVSLSQTCGVLLASAVVADG